MARRVFISVVLICLLITALSGLVSAAYVITGLIDEDYVYVLNLLFQITSLRCPNMVACNEVTNSFVGM